MTSHSTAAAITRDGKVVEVFRAQFISCPLDDSSHDGQAEGAGILPRASALPTHQPLDQGRKNISDLAKHGERNG
jgi:hypothetical protein